MKRKENIKLDGQIREKLKSILDKQIREGLIKELVML